MPAQGTLLVLRHLRSQFATKSRLQAEVLAHLSAQFGVSNNNGIDHLRHQSLYDVDVLLQKGGWCQELDGLRMVSCCSCV